MSRSAKGNEWFIRQIVEGDSLLSSDSIEHLSGQLGLSFRDCGYFCVVAQYAEDVEMTEKIEYPLSLYDACMSSGRRIRNAFFSYIGSGFCVVMVLSDDGQERSEVVEKLYHYLQKHGTAQIQLGVGRSYRAIEKLSYSRVEAYEALANSGSGGRIRYIDDIYVMRSFTTRKLESEKRRVIELFKAGHLDKMMEQITLLAENIRKESPVRKGMPYPTSIRRTILEVIVEVMHISADAGVDVDGILGYQDPYSRIFEIRDTPSILEWFRETTDILYQCMEDLTGKTENNMLRMAKKCIEEHIYDPDLSLSLVSGELGITATYFSAFFIREVGMGFNEYITGLRIDQAKQLLTTTNMKISEIAGVCGFHSPSYFTVVFRKQMGMSPGEYRNKKN